MNEKNHIDEDTVDRKRASYVHVLKNCTGCTYRNKKRLEEEYIIYLCVRTYVHSIGWRVALASVSTTAIV